MFGKDRMGAAGVAQKQAICVMDSGGGATPVPGCREREESSNRNPTKPTDYIPIRPHKGNSLMCPIIMKDLDVDFIVILLENVAVYLTANSSEYANTYRIS